MVRHGRQSAEAISGPSWETANPSLLREIPRSFSSSFVPTEICSSVSVAGPPSRDDMLIMSRTQAEAAANLSTVMTFLIGLGFIINLKKSVMTPTQQLEFLGFTVNSQKMTISLPSDKLYALKKLSEKDQEPGEDNGTGAFPTIGDDGGSSPGNSTSSVILPTLGGHKDQDAPNGGIIQLRDTRTHTQDGRGTHLVDFQSKWVQWSTSTSREMGVDDPLGSLQDGMGTHLRWDKHRRHMDYGGSSQSYQLSGTAGSILCPQIFCVPEGELLNPPPIGQCYSNCFYQQDGRHTLTGPVGPGS